MAVRRSWQRIEFLSTPSGWKATIKSHEYTLLSSISIHALRVEGDFGLPGIAAASTISIHALRVEGDKVSTGRSSSIPISIHALRVEGDGRRLGKRADRVSISIHALRVEGDPPDVRGCRWWLHFYPRPPGGRRHEYCVENVSAVEFLSTPSGWKATSAFRSHQAHIRISIHALRVEGDGCSMCGFGIQLEFLSTPSGWKATVFPAATASADQFLSTPSGWKATGSQGRRGREAEFLSTPSGWKATAVLAELAAAVAISIHALRVEGDKRVQIDCRKIHKFLSTPSGWKATIDHVQIELYTKDISIHALRVEGDTVRVANKSALNSYFYPRPPGGRRRQNARRRAISAWYFYPRPPGGRRHITSFRIVL